MSGSPYATLVGVLRGDVANLERAWFDHTSRHRCQPDGGCETRRDLRETLGLTRDRLAREIAKGEAA
jgi:hypothetical protein